MVNKAYQKVHHFPTSYVYYVFRSSSVVKGTGSSKVMSHCICCSRYIKLN